MNLQQFGEVIYQAVQSSKQEERQNGEKRLLEFKELHPVEFIQMATQILIEEKNPSDLRQAAGTLFKRVLTMSQGTDSIWDRLGTEQKQQIKEMLLQTLITKDLMARRAAADVIAAICAIELPRKQWPNIIQILVNQTNNNEEEIKKAAVMTLGFICENLKEQSGVLDDEQVKTIMTGILMSMRVEQTNEEIKYMGVKALQDSLAFMKTHLDQQEVRKYMMDQLVECVRSNVFKIKVKGIQTLVEFARLYVNHLQHHLYQISPHVLAGIEDEDTELSIICVEFYNTVAQEQKDKRQLNLQLVEMFSPEVVPKLLKNLMKEMLDEDDNGLQDASENALCSIMEIGNEKNVQICTTFIQNTINSTDINYKRAAMNAFGALVECPLKHLMNDILASGMPPICQILLDPQDQLSNAASATLSKIAELYPLQIINHPQMDSIMVCLVNSLQRNVKISKNICWCFNLMADEYPGVYQQNSHHQIFNYIEQMVQALLQNTQRPLQPTDFNIIDVSYLAIMNILHNIENELFHQKYLVILIDIFKNSHQVQGAQKQNIQSGVLACLHQSITKQHNISVDECKQIYSLIIQDFQKLGDVHSDGLYVICALATVMEDQFEPLLDDCYNYIKHGLQKTEDLDLFKSSLGTLGDICRSCAKSFEGYLQEVIPALLKCINLQTIDKVLKLAVFNCLGDIALSCPNTFAKYIDDIINVYNLGFVAGVQLQSSLSSESQDYGEQLKENLIESYTCFLHAMQDIQITKERVFQHLTTVVQFIENTCEERLNPTIDYIRMCLTLIADIANFYKDQVTQLVKTNFSQQLIHNLNKFNYVKENKETVQFAVQTLSKLQLK